MSDMDQIRKFESSLKITKETPHSDWTNSETKAEQSNVFLSVGNILNEADKIESWIKMTQEASEVSPFFDTEKHFFENILMSGIRKTLWTTENMVNYISNRHRREINWEIQYISNVQEWHTLYINNVIRVWLGCENFNLIKNDWNELSFTASSDYYWIKISFSARWGSVEIIVDRWEEDKMIDFNNKLHPATEKYLKDLKLIFNIYWWEGKLELARQIDDRDNYYYHLED